MTSPRRRLANRRNALRSSGPKTGEGKRRAAANSTQHGLTSPIESSPWADQLTPLTELLMTEGFSRPEAWQRARCILEYERNVHYQQERFMLTYSTGPQSMPHSTHASSSSGEDELAMAKNIEKAIEDQGTYHYGFDLKEAEQFARLLRDFAGRQARQAEAQSEKVLRNADRYLRRAANQLFRRCRVI